MKHQVDIQSSQDWYHLHQALLLAAKTTLSHESAEEGSLTLVLTDKDSIRDLNRIFAQQDYPTDVLSFLDGTIQPESGRKYFGDVIIAVDIAQTQADRAGHSLIDELSLLTVHGILHLLGHDHASPEEKDVMWSAQARILEKLGVAQPGEQHKP